KVEVGGGSEIRALADSFNGMSDELGKLYGSLETMAFTDALTGLPNRNRLQERLQHQFPPHRDDRAPFALLVMDLDRFKFINETLGHAAGDLLLTAVAARLAQALRSGTATSVGAGEREADFIARLGGDEFSVLLPGVSSAADASAVARRLTQAMETPFGIGEHQLRVDASIGIVLHPQHGANANDLMRRADVAMYQAKQTRAGYIVYDAGYDGNSLRRLALERDLREAVQDGQMVLYYQPKVDLRTGAVCGTEALVRWRHPELGMVPPDEFIALAEQTGLIHSLTTWVLDRAIQDCAAWRAQGSDVGVSVNLSAVSLHERDLCDGVRHVLERWHFDPAYLVLELTESAVMSDPERAIDVLGRLRQYGVGLSIDDFGTGYSSLAYVKRLPVTEIKVDRSFVRDVATDTGDASI
ncbi:MAG: EAL domain-containing protein, partial [Thiobacillus sp.]|nr:EAL domain-containing protein [Thiobacillus sp.]